MRGSSRAKLAAGNKSSRCRSDRGSVVEEMVSPSEKVPRGVLARRRGRGRFKQSANHTENVHDRLWQSPSSVPTASGSTTIDKPRAFFVGGDCARHKAKGRTNEARVRANALALAGVGHIIGDMETIVTLLVAGAILLPGIVTPLAWHWAQSQRLLGMGFHDLAGATFIITWFSSPKMRPGTATSSGS